MLRHVALLDIQHAARFTPVPKSVGLLLGHVAPENRHSIIHRAEVSRNPR